METCTRSTCSKTFADNSRWNAFHADGCSMQPLMSSMQSGETEHIWDHGTQRMAWDLLEKWRCPQIIPSSIEQSDTATVPQKGKEDGETTFFRDLQRHHEGHVLPLGETVMWRDRNESNCKFALSWVFGIWLHQECNVLMHAIATRQRTFLARAIRRLPPLERHGTEVFLAARGTPWSMRKRKHEEEVEDREHSNHQRDRSSQRARAMNKEGFHPRRNTRRDQHRKQLRFKDHTLQNM